MTLTMDRCFKPTFIGDDSKLFLHVVGFDLTKMKGPKSLLGDNLSWPTQITAKMKETHSVFCLLKKNLSYKLQAICNLGLYMALLLPVWTYGFFCASLSRPDMKGLEKFQKKVVQWITGSKVSSCISQLRWLNLRALPMFRQLSYILLLVKLSIESNQLQLQKNENLGTRTESFKLHSTRTESRRRIHSQNLSIYQSMRIDGFLGDNGPQGKNSGNYVETRDLWFL